MSKPHLMLTPVNDICVLDTILFHGELKRITKMKRGGHDTYVLFADGKCAWLNNKRKYYAETALQTYARSPRGRELLGASARGTWQTPDTPSPRYSPKLDDGQRRAVAQTREGCAASELTDPLQGVRQPRATVCMTLGKNLKHGDYVAVRVVEVPESKSKGLMLPNGVLLVTPERFYDKVN